jgi:hypothetical protein
MARAQDKSLESAKEFFDDGQNLYLQGKYLEAAERFMKAYEEKNYPAFIFNVAVCYEKNNDYLKAVNTYERYLKEDPLSPDRQDVLKRIAVIREHLNPPASQPTTSPGGEGTPSTPPPVPAAPPNLPPVVTKGLVVIESKPEGAAIYLGDKSKGIFTRTPYSGSLPPGKHTVILEMRKYKPERKTFSVRHDRLTYLYFALSSEEYLGWIEVKANVPGASVYFDKKEVGAVGKTPYTGFLRPGKRQIIVEQPGYAPYVQTIDITAGKDHVVNVNLKKVLFGWLKVTGKTTEGATVKVDGRLIDCKEYPCRTELPPGNYKVEIQRKDYKKYTHQISIKQATETQLAVRLNPEPSRLNAYITFGVAGALLAGAITTGVMSNNRKDSLESDLKGGRVYDSSDPRIDEGKITAIISDSLYALSGITAVLGVYYLLRNVGPDSYGETRTYKLAIIPALTPQMAGIVSQVRF